MGKEKIHFHPESWAQPVPTSAPLARAQPCSLCRGAQLPPNMAMLWPWFPRCRLAELPGGRPGGSGCREAPGWCGAAGTQPGLGKGGGLAAHKRGLGCCHITPGAPGQAPAGATKGAELLALHLGFLEAVKGNGKLEVPTGAGRRGEQHSSPTLPVVTPLQRALGAHSASLCTLQGR